jgi:hypothetical protein
MKLPAACCGVFRRRRINSKNEFESLYHKTLNSNGIKSGIKGEHEKFESELDFSTISIQLPIEI